MSFKSLSTISKPANFIDAAIHSAEAELDVALKAALEAKALEATFEAAPEAALEAALGATLEAALESESRPITLGGGRLIMIVLAVASRGWGNIPQVRSVGVGVGVGVEAMVQKLLPP
jgi:hypothetical protein